MPRLVLAPSYSIHGPGDEKPSRVGDLLATASFEGAGEIRRMIIGRSVTGLDVR